MSHDLRSPLTAIAAAASGLESSTLELDADDRATLLETIRVESKRLDRLVGNLLDLSRLQAGAAKPMRELWLTSSSASRSTSSPRTPASRSTSPTTSLPC